MGISNKPSRTFLAKGSDGKTYEVFEYNIIGPIGSDSGYIQHGIIGVKCYLSTGESITTYMGGDLIIDNTNIKLKEIKE